MNTTALIERFQVAELGVLLADPARAGILLALIDGTIRPAGELARMAGIAASTGSGHLHKLVASGLVKVVEQGRHRYYMLADDQVAHLLEMLTIERGLPKAIKSANNDAVVGAARTCCDHLAGRLGVAVFKALRESQGFVLTDEAVRLSNNGLAQLQRVGLLDDDAGAPNLPGRTCVDWTERRFHLGGPLGAWLAKQVFDKNWLCRRSTTRAITPTQQGRDGLGALGVNWDRLS